MADPNQNLSSEISLGYSTARSPLGNIESFQPDESVDYKFDPNKCLWNLISFTLMEFGRNNKDNTELISDDGKIILTYYAKAINMVASGNSGQVSYLRK